MSAELSEAPRAGQSIMLEGVAVAAHLPGEPGKKPVSAPNLLARALGTLLLLILTSGLWPLYIPLAIVYGRPPVVPRRRQILRYFKHVWTVDPPAPGMSAFDRIGLSLSILQTISTTPLFGLAWLIDEVLYGSALDDTHVVAPLIEISAARSGSTQLARYLEDDPELVAPMFIQCMMPYLWLWRLVPKTLGRFITQDHVRRLVDSQSPVEFLQRHEGDPFLTDTYDLALFESHLLHLSLRLGPKVMEQDFAFGALAPHNRHLWEEDFVEMLDRVARKTLLNAEPGPGGKTRRFFIKGHFLCAADALERRFPDARFLTMIREPGPRIQSAVNFLRATPFDTRVGGTTPWAWLGEGLGKSEASYCEIEQEWFTREEGPRRCVLRFSEYKEDLEAAMSRVYSECLDTPTLPPHVPRSHTKRERNNYLVNRSLAEVGIDEDALNERLADYISWCRASR